MRAYHGSRKRILSLDRLLQLVGLTGESLSAAPIPTVPEQSEPENRGYTADCSSEHDRRPSQSPGYGPVE